MDHGGRTSIRNVSRCRIIPRPLTPSTAAAAAEDIAAALKAAGATRFLDLVKAAGAVEAVSAAHPSPNSHRSRLETNGPGL